MHLVLSAAEKKRLKQLLKLSHECMGCVKRKANGELFFDEKSTLRMEHPTFHTHNKNEARDKGFDPPSKRDMETLSKYVLPHGHYVVTHRGIYLVTIDCRVKKSSARKLLRIMGQMQEYIKPGPKYNARYMKEVNSLAPECLKVTFTSWAKL